MMKRILFPLAAAAALVSLGAGEGPASDPAADTIAFVYHSDTRGYYRPCG